MIIHLWEQEKILIKKYAESYQKQTGDEHYSWKRICELLRERYEEKLDETLKEIMDIKVREFEDNKGKEAEDTEA